MAAKGSRGGWLRRLACLSGAVVAILLTRSPAQAHSFGARHDLPLPLWVYLAGAGAAVAISFVVMAIFMGRSGRRAEIWHRALPGVLSHWLTHPWLRASLQVAGVALFVLVLATGFLGSDKTIENFAPTFVWVIWWVGLAFAQALIGDLWALINPWRTLFAWAEILVAALTGGRSLSRHWPYPDWLDAWPAVVLFWLYAWFELVPNASQSPSSLATAVMIYSGITWYGMICYGRETWLARGEAFALFFGFLARFAPTVSRDQADGARRLLLRPFGVGLLVTRPLGGPLVVFVVLMLATVTVDGFSETPPWSALLTWMIEDQTVRPLLLWLRGVGFDILGVFKTVALVVFPLVFLAFYGGFSWLTARLAGGGQSWRVTAGAFVLTLVPIAIAYHLAHYFSYLVIFGQYMVPLASDPFGFGWDLFGTADATLDLELANPKLIWTVAALAILIGHLMSVYLAHVTALRLYGDRRAALASQVPMLVLMVLYTMTSLWIMAQPIVEDPSLF